MTEPYNHERLDVYVESGEDEGEFSLQRNGPRARTEFTRAEEFWAERERR